MLHIQSRGYDYWNGSPKIFQPALNVFTKARNVGFTAVILTFDRFEYLIKVIQRYSYPCITSNV